MIQYRVQKTINKHKQIIKHKTKKNKQKITDTKAQIKRQIKNIKMTKQKHKKQNRNRLKTKRTNT